MIAPFRDSHSESTFFGIIFFYIEFHIPIIRIYSLLPHTPAGFLNAASNKQMNIQFISVPGIDVFIHSHKQPCNIRRTARTVKPCLTFCLQMGIILSLFTFPWINLQCIRIKELCSALRHSNQNRIV